jgi:hypothetical protein
VCRSCSRQTALERRLPTPHLDAFLAQPDLLLDGGLDHVGANPDRASHDLALADAQALLDRRSTLAVSLEPRGGSRTGGPTGPVVHSGRPIKE